MKHLVSESVRSTQSVTITLPRDVITEAKHAAVDRGLSLSRFVAEVLEERLERAARYRAAKEEAMQAMKEGIPGFLIGDAKWTRDELHER